MLKIIKKIAKEYKSRKINAWVLFFVVVYVIFVIKMVTIQKFDNNTFFAIYSIAVSFYILSRFALAYLYKPERSRFDMSYQPTISFGVPSKNEGENIRETIMRIAATDYPKDKFDIIAINDGSDDNTLEEMNAAKKLAAKEGVVVQVIDWKKNKGKREGMAECVKQSKNEIVVFIDSDSFVVPSTAKELIKYFTDPDVSAVAGHAYVANETKNALTKMQAVRYYVAFKAYKASEALFDSVTCCSGCCSAYRRDITASLIDSWLDQKFLGAKCTYGDDRSLTNFLLRKGKKALFAPDAICYTFVPEKLKQFMKQQLRWKKSWVRESLIASTFIWKRNPIMSFSFYLGFILPLLAPVVVFRALVWYPIIHGEPAWYYLLGLVLMAVVYGLYYFICTNDKKWMYGVLFASFYTIILIWQLPWAIINIRDSRWGTR
jgi:hyaluronan synthase